ncbi:MAG: radical SAM protein [Eubacteriales bacterium]|nr:radical SAM protein [Eubacteriales bacterium]
MKNPYLYTDLISNKQILLNQNNVDLIKYCSVAKSETDILSSFTKDNLENLITHNVLVADDKKWNINEVECIDIEISTTCNWKCDYCPNKYYEKENLTMSMDLFNDILKKIKKFKNIKYITLNTYNEPSIDKFFIERIELIKKYDFKIILFTNTTGLNIEKINVLEKSKCIERIWITLPSLNEYEFERLTGSNMYNLVINNINELIKRKFKIDFSIQGPKNLKEENVKKIRENYYKILNHEIETWETTDRAGILKTPYYMNIDIKDDFLHGCTTYLNHLNINVKGEAFLCCNDYFQSNIYGNIKNVSIYEILNSKEAIKLRKIIFGNEKADKNFICRKCNVMQISKHLSRISRFILLKS